MKGVSVEMVPIPDLIQEHWFEVGCWQLDLKLRKGCNILDIQEQSGRVLVFVEDFSSFNEAVPVERQVRLQAFFTGERLPTGLPALTYLRTLLMKNAANGGSVHVFITEVENVQ